MTGWRVKDTIEIGQGSHQQSQRAKAKVEGYLALNKRWLGRGRRILGRGKSRHCPYYVAGVRDLTTASAAAISFAPSRTVMVVLKCFSAPGSRYCRRPAL